MADLTFNLKNTVKQSLRAAPSKYDKSKLRYNFEQSEGQRMAEVFYPHKYLPVQAQDVNTEDWVVITKGKVVSALGVGEHLIMASPSGTLGWPHASGTIPVFQDRNSATVTTVVDKTFWGYDDTVCGLLVPCNGGADRTTGNTYEYTANDVTAGTYKDAASLAANGDDVAGILISGNMPVGAAMYDIYQDIRGQNLNYTMWDKSAILSDWFVTVPFIRESAGNSHYFDNNLESESTADDAAGPNALRNLTYLTIPSGTVPRTGATVKADVRGNYTIQDPFDTVADVAGSTATANPTVQTVGRLVTLDTRFPKDLLNYVDTYEGSQMAGTDTAGVPYWLFIFCYNYLNAVIGSAPTIRTILNYIKSGLFGMARIQLHIN
jgi:hypothetical protein